MNNNITNGVHENNKSINIDDTQPLTIDSSSDNEEEEDIKNDILTVKFYFFKFNLVLYNFYY